MSNFGAHSSKQSASQGGYMHCTIGALFITSHLFVTTMAMKQQIKVLGAGVSSANGRYLPQPPADIPVGFAKVCKKSFWNTEVMWEQLSDLHTPWYLKDDDAYIYFNKGDGKWWLDAPEGNGLYIASGKGGINAVPPTSGWQSLREDYGDLPSFEFSDVKDDL